MTLETPGRGAGISLVCVCVGFRARVRGKCARVSQGRCPELLVCVRVRVRVSSDVLLDVMLLISLLVVCVGERVRVASSRVCAVFAVSWRVCVRLPARVRASWCACAWGPVCVCVGSCASARARCGFGFVLGPLGRFGASLGPSWPLCEGVLGPFWLLMGVAGGRLGCSSGSLGWS